MQKTKVLDLKKNTIVLNANRLNVPTISKSFLNIKMYTSTRTVITISHPPYELTIKYPSIISQGRKVIKLNILQNININLVQPLEEKVLTKKRNITEKIAVIMEVHKSWYQKYLLFYSRSRLESTCYAANNRNKFILPNLPPESFGLFTWKENVLIYYRKRLPLQRQA